MHLHGVGVSLVNGDNEMTIKLMLEVTIEGFKAEASEKGNYTARGVFAEIKKVTGATAEQITVFAPSYGNAGTCLFLTKDPQLVAKVNKAGKASRGGKAALPKELQGLTADQLAALVAAIKAQG
jgi:hypothetical protein